MRWRRLIFSVSAVLALTAACSQGRGTPTAFEEDDASADASLDQGAPNDARFGAVSDALELLEAGCAKATAHVLRDPIYMLLVLDGSGSMAQDQKWNAVVPAIEALIDDLQSQADPSFGMGLTIFSDTNDLTAG